MALETQRQRRPPRPGEPTAGLAGVKSASSASTIVQEYLNNCRSFYSCIYCRTHLANHDELVSRSFQGNRSRAYLFNSVVNISCGTPVQRELNTGSHAVADIYCTNCSTTIGWKYEKAYEDSQKYKEGKFIIELVHVVRENRHLELDKRDTFMSLLAQQAGPTVIEQVATTSPFGWTGGTGGYQYRSHRQQGGSLSPQSRPSSWSQPSSSTSSPSSPCSSSSSSASSPQSPNDRGSRGARVRFNISGQYEEESQDADMHYDQDELEHEEALMFPFYDDLYGNRSSYSNLSTSLSYFQRRLRRSLQMASAPLQSPPQLEPLCDNWKQPNHHRSPDDTCTTTAAEVTLNSTSSIDIPSTSTGCRRAPAVALPSDNDDRHATSAAAVVAEAQNGETQFELEHEQHGLASPVVAAAAEQRNCDTSRGGANAKSRELSTTMSLDDEEFYDCCTDHDVA